MSSKKIGRRKFIKGASSAVLGLAAAPFWNVESFLCRHRKVGLARVPDSGEDRIKGDSR